MVGKEGWLNEGDEWLTEYTLLQKGQLQSYNKDGILWSKLTG
jgi:hypothetical protein